MIASPLKSLLVALIASTLLSSCGPRDEADVLAQQAAELQNAEGAYVATSEST